jgi:hypothetical protein
LRNDLIRSAVIGGAEVTRRVINCRANLPKAWRLYPQELPRRPFAIEAVKGHKLPRALQKISRPYHHPWQRMSLPIVKITASLSDFSQPAIKAW